MVYPVINILNQRMQPENAGIDMICMPPIHSNISITAKFGVSIVNFTCFFEVFKL
jgi:hypothetical protein